MAWATNKCHDRPLNSDKIALVDLQIHFAWKLGCQLTSNFIWSMLGCDNLNMTILSMSRDQNIFNVLLGKTLQKDKVSFVFGISIKNICFTCTNDGSMLCLTLSNLTLGSSTFL